MEVLGWCIPTSTPYRCRVDKKCPPCRADIRVTEVDPAKDRGSTGARRFCKNHYEASSGQPSKGVTPASTKQGTLTNLGTRRKDDMDLKGKRIVVTGGGSGIAEATVYAYVKEGARVVLLDINDDAGARVAQAACKLAGSNVAEYLHCDISHRDEVFSVFAQAVDFLGGLDALAMIAGIQQQKASEDLVEADLFSQISVHFYGTVFTNGAAFKYMRETGGSIINYSSIAGVVGRTRMGSYSAAKAAVLGFTRVVAQDWGATGYESMLFCLRHRRP
jgi:NADP-dependent 3-hydroxy acid dehydrogenase YdfG